MQEKLTYMVEGMLTVTIMGLTDARDLCAGNRGCFPTVAAFYCCSSLDSCCITLFLMIPAM